MSRTTPSRSVAAALIALCCVGAMSTSGCADGAPTERTPTAAQATANGVVGHFRYMADAGRFRACGAETEFPVATEGDNAKLERAYLAAATKPAEPLLARFEGNLTWQPKVDGTGAIGEAKERAWYVERFIAVEPGADCP